MKKRPKRAELGTPAWKVLKRIATALEWRDMNAVDLSVAMGCNQDTLRNVLSLGTGAHDPLSWGAHGG